MLNTPTKPIFQPGVLYAVLLYRGDDKSWHHALFLPDPKAPDSLVGTGTDGMVCHCVNKSPTNIWRYEVTSPSALDLRARLVLGARLADLSGLGEHVDVAAGVEQVLCDVPVHADAHRSVFNCHKWMLDAVAALHDVGFIQCPDIDALERELIAAALLATYKYKQDKSFVMITPNHCSDS